MLLHFYVIFLYDTILECTKAATYLGVELTSKLIWTIHINKS